MIHAVVRQKEEDVIKFPQLMVSKDNKLVVLMVRFKTGVVISSDCAHNIVGSLSELWSMENFSQFHGDITLSNKEISQ